MENEKNRFFRCLKWSKIYKNKCLLNWLKLTNSEHMIKQVQVITIYKYMVVIRIQKNEC